VDDQLASIDAIIYPVESHADGLGAAQFDGSIDDAGGTGIVG
jgi:hypothetical protein